MKLDLIPKPEPAPIQLIEQNVSQSTREPVSSVAVEVLIDNLTLRLFNNVDEQLIQSTLKSIGEMRNACDISLATNIYIVIGYTDMRKFIDGLCAIIPEQLKEKPNGSYLYMFCGKRCGRIKVRLRESDG